MVSLVGAAIKGICSEFFYSHSYTDIHKNFILEFELCVVEAVTNAIVHAYGNQTGHKIQIDITLTEKNIILQIQDWGQTMDEKLITTSNNYQEPDPDDLESLTSSGRGLFLIQSVMDCVRYQGGTEGNRLIMEKRLQRYTIHPHHCDMLTERRIYHGG